MILNCGVGEDSWESLGLQGNPTSPSYRKSILNIHWKDCCWSWSSNTLATWCEELTHWKRPWSWERLKTGREGGGRGWDDWMASQTLWRRVWVISGSWWWTGKPGVLQSMWSLQKSETIEGYSTGPVFPQSFWAHVWTPSSLSSVPYCKPLAGRLSSHP